MLRPLCLSLGVLAGAAMAVLLWRGGLSEPFRQARASWSGEPPAVLVILVEQKRDVAAIRATVDPGRIVAHDESGFALAEGRVVAAGHDAVGTILSSAGWHDRPLEFFVPSSFTRGGELEPAEEPAGASAPLDDLEELMQKPTLSVAEARSVLRALDGR